MRSGTNISRNLHIATGSRIKPSCEQRDLSNRPVCDTSNAPAQSLSRARDLVLCLKCLSSIALLFDRTARAHARLRRHARAFAVRL